MKIYSLYWCLLLAMSFVTYAQQPPVVSIMQHFELKNTSIRAIEVVKDSTLWFAGSNGRYGRIINDHVQIDSVSHEGRLPHFRSIAFNGKHIFLLSIEDPALLYKIDPTLPLGTTELVYKESHAKVFYDSMRFFDRDHGIAIGDPVENCLSVIQTNDAGEHWSKLSCDVLPEVYEGEAAFAASNTNLALIEDKIWIATGGKKARVFSAERPYDKWTSTETPIVQGDQMTGIFTVAFYDKNLGIIMGGNWNDKKNGSQSKAITHNGGQTWKLTGTADMPGYISCVQFVPGKSGREIMAVSTEGIYFSDDTANTWAKIEDKGYYSLRFADEKTVWLSGNQKIVKIKI